MMAVTDTTLAGLLSRSASQTRKLGACLASLLKPGDLILLQGPFGAGKTVFAQGIAAGLGIEEAVTSPSFTLVNEYRRGRLPLFHLDLYRIGSPAEALELGLDEYLEGGGVAVAEWPDRVEAAFPHEHLLIRFAVADARHRELVFEARGERYRKLLHEFRVKCWKRSDDAAGH